MGEAQGRDSRGMQHQIDTLKRPVLFDDYIDVVSASVQPSMVSPVQIDISSIVSATATAVILSLFIGPSANAYWILRSQTDSIGGTNIHLQAMGTTINQFRTNYGIQPIASDKTFYYQAIKLSGGGNASWIVRVHGYIDLA